MDKCPHNGVEHAGYGEEDGQKIESHGKAQIPLDGGHHTPGEGKQVRQLPDFIVNERDIRSIDRNVAAHPAHRDADHGFFQRRGIVDAVTDHADGTACALAGVDEGQLVLGQAARMHLVNRKLAGDVLCGKPVVSCEQDGLYADLAECADGSRAVRAQGVRKDDIAGVCPADRHVDYRTAPVQEILGLVLRGGNALLLEEFAVSREHRLSGHDCRNAPSRQHLEPFGRRQGCSVALRIPFDNRLAEWVLGKLLGGGRRDKEGFFGTGGIGSPDGDNLGGTVGQGTGLVKGDFFT